MKGTVMYDAPRTMYLCQTNGYAYACQVCGETSRSWLVGTFWRTTKYAKSEYAVVSEAEFIASKWAEAHRDGIRDRLASLYVTPAQLRQIAAIIGYTEGA